MSSQVQAVRADIGRYLPPQSRTLVRVLRVIYREKGLQAVLVYRFGTWLRNWRKAVVVGPLLIPAWLLYGLWLLLIVKGYDIKLARSASIGPGLFIGHFGGIELTNCSLGANCSIGQETRIGRATEVAGPQIGDRVWIGSHVQIYGAVHVEEDATIAVGANVTSNVPKQSLMVGNPGRLASRRYDNSKFLGLS